MGFLGELQVPLGFMLGSYGVGAAPGSYSVGFQRGHPGRASSPHAIKE